MQEVAVKCWVSGETRETGEERETDEEMVVESARVSLT
jgi:hypothetical protein